MQLLLWYIVTIAYFIDETESFNQLHQRHTFYFVLQISGLPIITQKMIYWRPGVEAHLMQRLSCLKERSMWDQKWMYG